jgi:hypothetical protein
VPLGLFSFQDLKAAEAALLRAIELDLPRHPTPNLGQAYLVLGQI